VRFLGVLLFLFGSAGTGYCTWSVLYRKRPLDVAFSALAPIAVAIGVIGLALIFAPGFLG
jgi:hypothetical protein